MSKLSLHKLATSCIAHKLTEYIQKLARADAKQLAACALRMAKSVRAIGHIDVHYRIAYVLQDGRVMMCLPECKRSPRHPACLLQLYCTRDTCHVSNAGTLFQCSRVELQLVRVPQEMWASNASLLSHFSASLSSSSSSSSSLSPSSLPSSSPLQRAVARLFCHTGERQHDRNLFRHAQPYVRRIVLL